VHGFKGEAEAFLGYLDLVDQPRTVVRQLPTARSTGHSFMRSEGKGRSSTFNCAPWRELRQAKLANPLGRNDRRAVMQW